MYCSRCNMNWARLWTIDADGDESYDYCPTCSSSFHLEANRDGDLFIKCAITGEITNITTPEADHQVQEQSAAEERKPFDKEVWRLKQEENELEEDKHIAAYIIAYESEGPQKAAEVYHNRHNIKQ